MLSYQGRVSSTFFPKYIFHVAWVVDPGTGVLCLTRGVRRETFD